MAISNDMKTWEKFVDQFAEKVKKVLGLNENWIVGYHNINDFMAKIEHVEKQINAPWSPWSIEPTELHRMIAQMILRRPSLDYPLGGEILHKLGRLILTTNYDTVIEDCVPNERISMYHIEASKYIDPDVLHGLKTLGPGPLFQNPLKHLFLNVYHEPSAIYSAC